MPEAITNTSPMLYLYRIGMLDWLPQLCNDIWIPRAVVDELQDGRRKGYDVPIPSVYTWLQVVEPRVVPSEWFALDLGAGELAVLAIALEHPQRVILLDDGRARRIAQAAGLTIWGTLKILPEAKSQGLTDLIGPHLDRLRDAGMWMSEAIRQRVLALAGERLRE
jgi:predicted nucleic acid-binding protein